MLQIGRYYSRSDEREFNITTRALAAFEAQSGRLWITRLPQRETKSVAVCQEQMTLILQEEISENLGIFIDYGGIQEPISKYKNKPLNENQLIRGFVWKYAVTLERILFRKEEEGLTISGSKLAFCVQALDIVGHVVSLGVRNISKKNINKIKTWPIPATKKEVRGF
ncbi:hypothetical protein O181_008356 [Austropuccinia psidii MF-1]|uniref:Uncharacterized protein n=1 Tax=Austropuccinia psidii MF-1 TaxID=1389203 RepID=A0A9Q3GIF8_9BASI|nr:hypothetical protein [Austropuccinia psidii MF-1]